MQSVIVISEKPLDLAAFAKTYESSGRVDLQSPQRCVVEGEWGWFAFDVDQSLADDFDESELEQVHDAIPAPLFAELTYSSVRAADIAISLLPEAGVVFVDNDYGLLAQISEIRRRIQSGSQWHAVAS